MMSAQSTPINASLKAHSEHDVPMEYLPPQPAPQPVLAHRDQVVAHLSEEDYNLLVAQQLMQQGQPQGGAQGALPETSSAIDRSKYKTRLCRNWTNGQDCPYGDRCVFAHGEHEKKREGPLAPGQVDMTNSPAQAGIVPQTQPLVLRRQQSTPMARHLNPANAPRTPVQLGLPGQQEQYPAYMQEQSNGQAVYYSDFPPQGQYPEHGPYENQSFVSDTTHAMELETPQQTPLSANLSLPSAARSPPQVHSPVSVCLESGRTSGMDDRLHDSLCSSPTTLHTPPFYRYEPYGSGYVHRLPVALCSSTSSNTDNGLSDQSDTSSEAEHAIPARHEPSDIQIQAIA